MTSSTVSETYLDVARRQAQLSRAELVKSGHLVNADVFCNLLGINLLELQAGHSEKRYFGIEVGEEFYYPSFYADSTLKRSEIEAISELLLDLDGGVKWQFFSTPKLTLNGVTPLTALAQGRFQDVAFAAGGFASL